MGNLQETNNILNIKGSSTTIRLEYFLSLPILLSRKDNNLLWHSLIQLVKALVFIDRERNGLPITNFVYLLNNLLIN